jgi:hypothetical protein
MRFLNLRSLSFVAFLTINACSPSATDDESIGEPVAGDDANLTQARVPMNQSPSIERLRADYEMAVNSEAGTNAEGFFGYAAAFQWGSDESLAGGLTDEQKTFLGTKLMRLVDDVPDRLPSGAELRAVEVDLANAPGLADAELRLTLGSVSQGIAQDIDAVVRDGHLVLRLEPAKAPPQGVTRRAGAIVVVDLQNREALVLYGRLGPAPVFAACTVAKMISPEWEESLSQDEYPNVDAAEVPLFGDVLLDIGVNRTLSNADAIRDAEDYRVTTTKNGAAFEIEAKSATAFRAKLVVEGKTGVIYGDREGTGTPVKAAELTCETAR